MDNPALQGFADKAKVFDAFPKVETNYTTRSTRGGALTLVLVIAIWLLIWTELKDYAKGVQKMEFVVDKSISTTMQVNIDLTMAMPCNVLNVDVIDAAGDRLHVSDAMVKEPTEFSIGTAKRMIALNIAEKIDVRRLIGQSRSGTRKFGRGKTMPDGRACRLYGNFIVNKVTANLHFTAAGHGYGWEHTDHAIMNFSHIIHELSFGDFYPSLVNPLDNSLETTEEHFQLFQYYVSLIPTTYIDSFRRTVHTHQYAVTDQKRIAPEGAMRDVPGVFIKYDLEPLSLYIRDESIGLGTFLVRLSGVIGGVVTCVAFAYRLIDRVVAMGLKKAGYTKRRGRMVSHDLDSPAPPPSYERSEWLSSQGTKYL